MKTTKIISFALFALLAALVQATEIEINYPYQDTTWTAGADVKIGYYAAEGFSAENGLSVQLERINNADRQIGLSWFTPEEGHGSHSFHIWYGAPGGYYRLRLVKYDEDGNPQVLVRSDAVIRLASSITAPAEGVLLKAGKTYRLKWVGQEDSRQNVAIYLVGSSEPIYLGRAIAKRGQRLIRIPRKVKSGEYRIWFAVGPWNQVQGDIFTVSGVDVQPEPVRPPRRG